MNQAERDLIASLFDRIRSTQDARRDPEAEAMISDEVARQPHAPYAMAQTVVVQDEALKAAQARIETLERELAAARSGDVEPSSAHSPWGPRAQDAMGRPSGFGEERWPGRDDGHSPPFGAPQGTPGARPTYGGSGLAPGSPLPGAGQTPQPEAARGGGFLSGALQTAAGVAAGALLFQGVRSLFGGQEERHAEAGEAARFGGEGGQSEPSEMSSISDQFAGWFGNGGREDAARPQDEAGDDGFDPGDDGDDRWI